jgi:hypothetical protein
VTEIWSPPWLGAELGDHGGRDVDSVDANSPGCEGQGDPTGADREFQRRSTSRQLL